MKNICDVLFFSSTKNIICSTLYIRALKTKFKQNLKYLSKKNYYITKK